MVPPSLLPSTNEVCEGYDFTPVCHSVQKGGGSRPTPKGMLRGLAGGSPGPHPGVWAWGGVSRGRLGGLAGGSPGPHLGGAQAHTGGRWGFRSRPGGVCIPACTEADPPPPSRRLLLLAVRILLECILGDNNFLSRYNIIYPPPPADGYCCWQYASYWNAFSVIIISSPATTLSTKSFFSINHVKQTSLCFIKTVSCNSRVL